MLVRQKKRYLISAFIFLFLLVGTGAGFFLLKNSQDVRQQASGGCKPGEPYCSCNLNGQACVLVDPDGPRKIVDQGSLENLKGILSTSFTGERPTTGSACGGVWMNNFCYMPGDEIAGGFVVVESGRYNYPYLEKKATHDSLSFGAETVTNQIGTVQSLGQDCGGNGHLIGNNCYAFGAVVNGYLVMPNRTSGCDNSTGDYCYAHLKKIDVSYSDWQAAVDKYEETGDSTKLEQLYKKTYGISFQPGELYDPKASNADLLKAQALIASLTSAQVLQKNAEAENKALEKKGNLTANEQATYDFNKQIIESTNLDKSYQLLDQLNNATSQTITLNNAISQMYSDLVVAKGDANLNKLASIKFKEIFGYDPSTKYGDLNGILGAFGIDSAQLAKDRDNYAKAVATALEKQNEAIAEQNEDIAEQNENIDQINKEYQEYVSGQSSNINDLKQAALDAGVITTVEIKNLSEEDLLALLLSKLSDTTLAQAKQDAIAIVTARETSVKEQELTQNYISGQEGEDTKDNLLELYKLYVGHAPTYRMTTSELEKEIAKHNSQIALSLYAQTQDVSYLNNYFTSNFDAPDTQLTRVLGDPKALLNNIYGADLGNELYNDIVLPNRLNDAIADFPNDAGTSLVSVCKDLGVTNCNITSTNATSTLSLMLDKMYEGRTDISIPDLAASYSNQIYADSKDAAMDATLEKTGSMIGYSSVSNANGSMAIGQWLGNLLMGKTDQSVSDLMAANVEPYLESYSEADQALIVARQAIDTFNASQAFNYATENRADLSDYTWGLSYGNALMADNVFDREFSLEKMDLNAGQTVSLTFNQLSSQIANVDVAQNIATNYATSKYYDYTGPADTKIANIALIGAENLNVLDYDYQEAQSGYYTDKTLDSWGESIGEAMTYMGASYASSQMNQMALNQSFYSDDNNFEFVDPVAYAEQAREEFKATYHEDMVNDLYEEYVVTADIQNVTKLDYEQFINDPEIQRSSQELNYERLEKVVAPAAAIVVLPAMVISGVGVPIILGAASSAFSLYQGAGMKAQALEIQRIDIETRENAVVQSYIENGASESDIADLRLSLDTQVETLNKQGNLMLANSAVAALTSAGGFLTSIASTANAASSTINLLTTSGQVLTKAGQIGGIAMNSYNAVNSGIASYEAFSQGNIAGGVMSGLSSFIAASGVAGNTFGVFGPTTYTTKIDYVLDAMNVPAGAAVDAQQVAQACFGSSDAFSEKDCTNAWIGLALSAGQNVSQISSSYKAYRSNTDVARVTDLQKQLDVIDLEILALNGPNKGLSAGLQINDLALQRVRLVDQIAAIDPNFKVASINSTEDYLATGMRISLDLETKAQAAIDAGQDSQAMRLIEQAEIFRNKPVEVSSLRDQISAIDEQVSKKGLFLSTDELTELRQSRNDLVSELESVVRDLSSVESMHKQNDIILQTVRADAAFQEIDRLLAVDTQKAELVKIYTPDTETVAKYRDELADAEIMPKLETDSSKRLISLEVLQGNLSKITELESNRQALVDSSDADSEVVKTEISRLDAEISNVRSMVDGVSVDKRSILRKFTDLFSPNKTSNDAYYKSLELTREAESLKARLADSSLAETDVRNLKNQLAEVNRQLIDQKYLLAQDVANPSKNIIQRVAELVPNIIFNRQIANLKTAARKLGDANLKIAESIISKQAEITQLREQGVLNETETARVTELEAELADLSRTAENFLKGKNAIITVDQSGDYTRYVVADTEAGRRSGVKQGHLDIINRELASFEAFKRQETGIKTFKIYSGTDTFKDQDIFLLAELEAFGVGRRGTVFGALPGMGKTEVVMPFNVLLKQRLTGQPQFVVFPEAKLMKPWTTGGDNPVPNKEFIDYVEQNFGKGSVVIVRANDTSIDPATIAKAKFVITTKDVAFDLQNTGTRVGLALRSKWKTSFVHADEVDWTFNPNENYKLSGTQVALRDKPEFDLYLGAQKSILGLDENGSFTSNGLSSLRNLINQLETSKSIPDGIVRTADGKGGKFADVELEKQVLSEWLGTWGGQSKIAGLDMSADIATIRQKINSYLSTDTDAQTHVHRAELAMINETVNFLSRVPGEDYGLSSSTRMNGDAEETIKSIAPKEQNRDTGRSYSAVAESLLYNTLGARIVGASGQVDLAKLTVGENGSEINYALLMLESRGFSLYTGTPETVAKLYKMAYGIELKVFTDSAIDDTTARFKKSDSAVFTDLESQITSRLKENKDQVFINMVSGLRSNEVTLDDLVTKVSIADAGNQTYKKLILIGASGKLTEYDLVDGSLRYVRDFSSTSDLNTRTAELNNGNQRYIKFYEYGAHVGVDTANKVEISRAVGLCNGCDATTFAQGINRVRVQVVDDPDNVGKKKTISAPMDVVWLDAPSGKKNLNIDDFVASSKDRQVINEALAEVFFKETLLRNSVDATFADLIELARNGKKGFLGFGAYKTNQDLVAQLEAARQKWKETTQMNYMLGSDDLSAQAKLEKTAAQVAGAYEELSRLLVGSGEPAKLLATRADGAIGNDKLQLAFSGDDTYKVLGEKPSYRQIIELINQSSKHLENVDIAFTNRSSQTEVVQSEMAKAAEVSADNFTRNNGESVDQNIFQKTAKVISQSINSKTVQKIVRTPITLFSSAFSAIVDFFSEEEIAPEILAQRDGVISSLKITDEEALIALGDLTTEEEIADFVAQRQLAYQQLKDQFAALNTVRPAINNEEDYKTQKAKFDGVVAEIEDLQNQSGLDFFKINENGEISRVNEDQFKNLSTFRTKAEIQIEKLAKVEEAVELAVEELAPEEAKAVVTTVAATAIIDTIGRDEDNSLQTLPGIYTVSRKHAEIIKDNDGKLYVRDLKSTNGTYVNGERIDAETNVLLTENDTVFLGSLEGLEGITFKVVKNSDGQLDLEVSHSILLIDKPIVATSELNDFYPTEGLQDLYKASRTDRPAMIAKYKKNLILQKQGIADTQEFIISTLEENPDANIYRLIEEVKTYALNKGLNIDQINITISALRLYENKRQEAKKIIGLDNDPKALFKETFGFAPIGKVQVKRVNHQVVFYVGSSDIGRAFKRSDSQPIDSSDKGNLMRFFVDKIISIRNLATDYFRGSSLLGFQTNSSKISDNRNQVLVINSSFSDAAQDSTLRHEMRHAIVGLLSEEGAFGAEVSDEIFTRFMDAVYTNASIDEFNQAISEFAYEARKWSESSFANEFIAQVIGSTKGKITFFHKIQLFSDLNFSSIYKHIARDKKYYQSVDFYDEYIPKDESYIKSYLKIINKHYGLQAQLALTNDAINAYNNLINKGYSQEETFAILQSVRVDHWMKNADRMPSLVQKGEDEEKSVVSEIDQKDPVSSAGFAKDIDKIIDDYAVRLSTQAGADIAKIDRVKTFFSQEVKDRVLAIYTDLLTGEDYSDGAKLDHVRANLKFVLERAFDQHLDNPEQYVSHGFDHTLNVIRYTDSIIEANPELIQKVQEKYGIGVAEAKFLLRTVSLFHDFGYPVSEASKLGKAAHGMAGADIINYGKVVVNGQEILLRDSLLNLLGSDNQEIIFDLRDGVLFHSADKVEHSYGLKMKTSRGDFLLDDDEFIRIYNTFSKQSEIPTTIEKIYIYAENLDSAEEIKKRLVQALESDNIDAPIPEIEFVVSKFKGRKVDLLSKKDSLLGLEFSEVVLMTSPLQAIIRLADNMDMQTDRFSTIQREPLFQAFYKELGAEGSQFFKANARIERLLGIAEKALKVDAQSQDAVEKTSDLKEGIAFNIASYMKEQDSSGSFDDNYLRIMNDLEGLDVSSCENYWKEFIFTAIADRTEFAIITNEKKEEIKNIALKQNSYSYRHFGGCEAVRDVRISPEGVFVEVDQNLFDLLNQTRVTEEIFSNGETISIEIGIGEYQIWRMSEAYNSIRFKAEDGDLPIFVNGTRMSW